MILLMERFLLKHLLVCMILFFFVTFRVESSIETNAFHVQQKDNWQYFPCFTSMPLQVSLTDNGNHGLGEEIECDTSDDTFFALDTIDKDGSI